MAPGPVQLLHNSLLHSNRLGTLALPTQEETQVCTRMMSTLLKCRLQEALAAEALSMSPLHIYFEEADKNSEFVNCYDRDRMVRWLCILTHDFHYCLEVFFRAAAILDSFLSVMRVRQKFLQCVTATCFFVASKLEEKPECLDTVLGAMVLNYSCQFSSRDVHRMELIIMQKLDFKLNNYTLYDFLKLFHIVGITSGSLVLPVDLSPDQHLCHTALCMEEVVSNHSFMKYKSSLLALAVLGCDLKLLGCDWLTAVVTLQTLAGVRGGELSVCYETVAPFYNAVALHHPLYISPKPPTPTEKTEDSTGPDSTASHAVSSVEGVKEAPGTSGSEREHGSGATPGSDSSASCAVDGGSSVEGVKEGAPSPGTSGSERALVDKRNM